MAYDVNDRPEAIRELQSFLRRIESAKTGLPFLAIDGKYGPNTRRAVLDFQRAEGLPATGKVDFPTWNGIYAEYIRLGNLEQAGIFSFPVTPPGDMITENTVGDLVILLKLMLRTLATVYDFEDIDTENVYDESTVRAIKMFQGKNGLPETGRTDVTTWNKIVADYNNALVRYDG